MGLPPGSFPSDAGQTLPHSARLRVLQQPEVTAPIVGASKMPHLEDAVAALSLKLDDAELEALAEPYQPHRIPVLNCIRTFLCYNVWDTPTCTGIGMLDGRHGEFVAVSKSRVLALLEQPPPQGMSHWEGPAVAERLGSSVHAVWRVLRREGIYLQPVRSWCEYR